MPETEGDSRTRVLAAESGNSNGTFKLRNKETSLLIIGSSFQRESFGPFSLSVYNLKSSYNILIFFTNEYFYTFKILNVFIFLFNIFLLLKY